MVAKAKQPTLQAPLRLKVPAGQAREKLAERVEKGKTFLLATINTPAELERMQNEYYKWTAYNKELLNQLFTNDSIAGEYSLVGRRCLSRHV